MMEMVLVQFLKGGKLYPYAASGLDLKIGALCVVEGEQGPAVARVVRVNPAAAQENGGRRRVLRLVHNRDLEQLRHNERLERDAYRLCRNKVKEKNIPMKLVDVTYTLEGRKAVFYFTSENRVDFRELVKELAQALRVKIEMRQIGVRDEARRLGGVGPCGRSLCCCTFMKDFVSVSIRMAKDQNVSLNPSKVSGICGRLMCCLSYEYEGAKGKRKRETEPKAVPACADSCPAAQAAGNASGPACQPAGGGRHFPPAGGRPPGPGGSRHSRTHDRHASRPRHGAGRDERKNG